MAFTYTINLKMAVQGWYIANFAHFWSLAVEEQYYLVWPFLMLLVPRRSLLLTAVIVTAIGPLFCLWLAFALAGSRQRTILAQQLHCDTDRPRQPWDRIPDRGRLDWSARRWPSCVEICGCRWCRCARRGRSHPLPGG